MRSLLLCLIACALGAASLRGAEAEPEPLEFDRPQTAGIAGFRAFWDTPVVLSENGSVEIKDAVVKNRGGTAVWSPEKRDQGKRDGALAFDALERSLLVRFPGAAEKIAERLNQGYAIKRVELALPYKDTEIWPPGDPNWPSPDGYQFRMNWGVDKMYRESTPNWHAIAWALRRPWSADAQTGPTFNAFIPGAGYWARFGAQDETKDRVPQRFGPAEISEKSPEGVLDVTASLTDAAFGKTLAERMRTFSDCGFLVRKWETYDHRYFNGVYEWGTGAGGRGILIKTPRLKVFFTRDEHAEKPGTLAPETDLKALAEKLKASGDGGKPTALMPSGEQLQAWATAFGEKPAWMPDWQFERVKELAALKKTSSGGTAPFWYDLVGDSVIVNRLRKGVRSPDGKGWIKEPEKSEDVYAAWVDQVIGRQPRGWYGFEAAREMNQWYLFNDALPEPAKDAIRAYWTAWLMPDRPTKDLVHPMEDQIKHGAKTDKGFADEYYARTGDWRGNKSFYRAGFNFTMSTQNFNVSASSGAMLGGSIIQSEYAMADGRHGFEHFPLRLWSWYDGSSQEAVDHYYYAITASGMKAVADFGPSPYDRLMGQSALAKTMEELTACYHPELRRLIAGSSRTSLEYTLGTQDGLQFILHTLSKSGTLHDLGTQETPAKLLALGHEVPPERIVQQSHTGPWAPEWVANLVDAKPLPFEMTAAYKQWGAHAENPIWRRTYLGKNYGLASTDLPVGRIQVMAQWRRENRKAEQFKDVVTLDMRVGINETRWSNDAAGWIAPLGSQAVFQSKNKLIAVTSPFRNGHVQEKAKGGLKSVQSSIALFNFQEAPAWEIYCDGQRVTQLPFKAKALQRFAIKDGVSYLGVIPLPAADLGRSDEVVLQVGEEQEFEKVKIKAALVFHNYNLKKESDPKPDWDAIDKAYGGFVVELGDADEYGNFEAFQKHLAEAKLDTRWEAETQTFHVSYKSGNDLMEMGALTSAAEGAKSTACMAYRKLNGQWPYLAKDVERDSPVAQQTRTGRTEKNGCTVRTEPGRVEYLLTDPASGTFSAFNVLPDLALWSMECPGGIKLQADGRLGLARVTVCPAANKVWVECAFNDAQLARPDRATALALTGFAKPPEVLVNGARVTEPLAAIQDGKVLLVPLPVPGAKFDAAAVQGRLERVQQLTAMTADALAARTLQQTWWALGPFPNKDGSAFDTVYAPEEEAAGKGVDLAAVYKGLESEVKWQKAPAAEKNAESVDLGALIKPASNVCAYAYAVLRSDRERTVNFQARGDDSITLWLNGKKVVSKNGGDCYQLSPSEVTLKQGDNPILVKVCQGGGGWSFRLMVTDEFGLPLNDGLEFR